MVKVYLYLRKNRKYFECQWTDPVTGKTRTKSTKTAKRREAERIAGALEADLNSGRHEDTVNTTWATLADRYESEVLDSLAVKTKGKFKAARNAMNELINPKHANTINSSVVSKFQAGLRSRGLAEATIKGHLASLKACFNWAVSVGLMRKAPAFTMPKRVGKMKGRPITEAEFNQIIQAIELPSTGDPIEDGKKGVLPASYAEPWRFMLRGLWASGLRLDEALRLSWDEGGIVVNLAGAVPRLKIEANSDKSGKPRLLPIAPEFADFLLSVPPEQRKGKVFRPIIPNQVVEMRLDTCSKTICKFGEKAKIVVAEYPARLGRKEPRKKFASAHDFRRTFGTRWAKVLRPQQLQDLMRHESLQTTMTFYVEESIADVESAMRKKSSDNPSDTRLDSGSADT